MAKTVGLAAKREKKNPTSSVESGQALQAKANKLRKENDKTLGENRVLKKEVQILKNESSEEKIRIDKQMEVQE